MWQSLLLLCVSVSAKVTVLSPPELLSVFEKRYEDKDHEIPSSLADFGNPPYGTQMVGKAHYHSEVADACSPVDHIEIEREHGLPILMADRGNCSFAMKARHAQDAGYKALVVVDFNDEDVTDVVMSDNGSGGNLFIPTFMIDKKDGNEIKSFAGRNDSDVQLKLSFDVEKRTRVNLRVVYSSDNAKALNFFADFATYGKKFNRTTLNFRPHFVLWYCTECLLNGYNESNEDCLSGGRYCAPDPDGSGALTGRDVVLEDLRQLCLLSSFANSEFKYPYWFQYMAKYNSTCRSNITESCSYSIMQEIPGSVAAVQQCIRDSAKDSGDLTLVDNTLLRKEVRYLSGMTSSIYPAMILNNHTYRGDWEGLQLAQTICSSYFSPPDFCAAWATDTPAEANRGLGLGTVMLIVGLVLVLVLVVLLLYRAWAKRELALELRQQVNLAMSQYYALSSEGSQLAERRTGGRK